MQDRAGSEPAEALTDIGSGEMHGDAMRSVRRTETRMLLTLMLVIFVSGGTLMAHEDDEPSIRHLAVAIKEVRPDSTVEDIDGNVYKTVRIGGQVWMAENLRVTRYRNGDVVPKVTEGTEWESLSTGALSAYDNNEEHVSGFGLLYNWYSVSDPRGLAPEGWHVPTDEDWKELEKFLGMSQQEADGTAWRGIDAGGKLKGVGTALWEAPNAGATNESGFTAVPAGYRFSNGRFGETGNTGSFWSSTEHDGSTAWSRSLYFRFPTVYRYNYPKVRGFSVRCIRDTQTGPDQSPN